MQFFLYCLCGGMGVSTDYAVFYATVTAGMPYQGANALGYVAGTFMSFALNRVFTFGMRDQVLQRLGRFLGVAAVGYLASALMLLVLVQWLMVDARIAKLLTLPLVVVLQFSLNKRITFKADQSRAVSTDAKGTL
jgi:putative flippase GtrA